MSWDVDEKEFYETFAEITEDRGLEEAKRWAWSALDWTQKELRKKEEELTEERAAVVAWLRNGWCRYGMGVEAAAAIERGEHHREEKE
jgi:hypothetical protein